MKARTLGFAAGLGLLAPCAWGSGTSPAAPSTGTDISSEVLRGYTYQLAPPVKIAVPVIAARESGSDADPGAGIVRMVALEVTGKPDQTFRDVNAALAEEKRSIPCDLFVRKSAPSSNCGIWGPQSRQWILRPRRGFPRRSFRW